MELVKRHPALFALLSFFLITLPGAIDSWISLEERAKNMLNLEHWFLWVSPIVGLVLLVIIIYQLRERKKRLTIATGTQLNKEQFSPTSNESGMPRSHFENRKLYIGELFRDEHNIDSAVFKDCEIIGPGMVGLDSNTRLNLCEFHFGKSIDDMLIVISGNRFVTGGVGFTNCLFENCAFKRVGFLVNEETARKFREQIKIR